MARTEDGGKGEFQSPSEGRDTGGLRERLLKTTHGGSEWKPIAVLVERDAKLTDRIVLDLKNQGCSVYFFPDEEMALKFLPLLERGRLPDVVIRGRPPEDTQYESFKNKIRSIPGLEAKPVFSYESGKDEPGRLLERIRFLVKSAFSQRRLLKIRQELVASVPPLEKDIG